LNCFNDVIFGYLVTKHNPPKGGKIFTRSGDLEVIGSRFVRIKLIITLWGVRDVLIFIRNNQKISLFSPLKGGDISSLRVIEIAPG
jgi:hypothetical protein